MTSKPTSKTPMSEVGIDITKQKAGTIITIETESDQIFELKITIPEKAVVEVTGTDQRLRQPVLGVLTHSFSGDKKTQINNWIGMLLRVSLVFKNGNLESTPVTHATIRGKGWSYNVF